MPSGLSCFPGKCTQGSPVAGHVICGRREYNRIIQLCCTLRRSLPQVTRKYITSKLQKRWMRDGTLLPFTRTLRIKKSHSLISTFSVNAISYSAAALWFNHSITTLFFYAFPCDIINHLPFPCSMLLHLSVSPQWITSTRLASPNRRRPLRAMRMNKSSLWSNVRNSFANIISNYILLRHCWQWPPPPLSWA